MPRKPKQHYTTGLDEVNLKDLFQTPSYALDPLLPYLKPFTHVRESACGEGYLVRALRQAGKVVEAHDLQLGDDRFTLATKPGVVEVTNVPFGKKYDWIRRSLQDGQPFALLMPSDVLFAGKKFQPLMAQYGMQMLVPDKRINFKTPVNGWANSNAQMHCSWVTWKLELPEKVTFCAIHPRPEPELALHERMCPARDTSGSHPLPERRPTALVLPW